MKTLLVIFGLFIGLISSAQDTVRYFYQDSLLNYTVINGNKAVFYKNDTTVQAEIIKTKYGRIWIRADTAFYLQIEEPFITFYYDRINGEWDYTGLMQLETPAQGYPEGYTPYFKDRCHAITSRGSRCKKEAKYGNHCYWHKE